MYIHNLRNAEANCNLQQKTIAEVAPMTAKNEKYESLILILYYFVLVYSAD